MLASNILQQQRITITFLLKGSVVHGITSAAMANNDKTTSSTVSTVPPAGGTKPALESCILVDSGNCKSVALRFLQEMP
jgi:hypothetical protein